MGREVLVLVDEARAVKEEAARALDRTWRPRAVRSGQPRVYEPDAVYTPEGEPLYKRNPRAPEEGWRVVSFQRKTKSWLK